MQHAYWIRNGAPHDATTVLDLAVAAEEGGWDGVLVSDAVTESHSEPFTLLAAIAARTDELVLGTWLTPLLARDVVHVARSIANVDRLAGGRLLVGLGLGNPGEHEALGIDRERLGERYDAALDVLDRLLRGESVTRHDDGLDLEQVRLVETPVTEPRPPFLLGGSWPATAPVDRAARWDGYLPEWPGLHADDDGGALVAELRELMRHYRAQGGDGLVVAPRLARYGAGYAALCDELGIAWLLTCDVLSAEELRAGPAAVARSTPGADG